MLKKKKDKPKNVVEWLERGEYDCMITLTFRADKPRPGKRLRKRISDEVAHRYLGKLISRLRKAIQPRNSKKRIIMVPVLERTTLDEPHFHILVRLGEDVKAIKKLIRDIWINVAPGITGDPLKHDKKGDKWFKVISDPNDLPRIIEYVTKWRSTNLDGLVLKYTHLGPVND